MHYLTRMPGLHSLKDADLQVEVPRIGDVQEMLCQVLEVPKGTLSGGESLSDLEAWDSLAILNFMALVDARFGITLSPDTILACQTVRDLAILLNEVRNECSHPRD